MDNMIGAGIPVNTGFTAHDWQVAITLAVVALTLIIFNYILSRKEEAIDD